MICSVRQTARFVRVIAVRLARVNFVIVFFGAGIGGIARYGVGIVAARALGTTFPVGTLAINVAGSFLIGLAYGWLSNGGVPIAGQGNHMLRLLLMTGFLGGFTTYSSFTLEAAMLWEGGQPGAAILYVAASLILGLGAVAAGLSLVRLG